MSCGRLKDKVIIVTGGSGLLGKSIMDHCKKNGGIAINVDIDIETNLSKGEIRCDVTTKEGVAYLVEEVLNYYHRIDGLVNNAYPRTDDWGVRFEDIIFESWQKNVDMQMNSVFLLCQKVLETMKIKKSGSIVNIASIYGVVGNDLTLYENTGINTAAPYSAIKGGVINFTRYLASYYGKYGVRINCVSPGGIFNDQNEIFVRNYEKKVPMGRMGKPDDIAPAVSFLLSEEANYITGQNLIVDGGWTAI